MTLFQCTEAVVSAYPAFLSSVWEDAKEVGDHRRQLAR